MLSLYSILAFSGPAFSAPPTRRHSEVTEWR